MTEHRIELDGYTLRVAETGVGRPVVFAHSLTLDSSMWDAQIAALSGRFRLVLVDLHGHGGSGAPRRAFTLEDVAGDVVAALDRLDIGRFAWVGHSMGGMIGIRVALGWRERVVGLALLNTSAEEQGEPARSLFHQVNEDSRGKPPAKQTVDFVLSLMLSTSFRERRPDVVERFARLLYEPADAEGVYWMARAVIWRTSVAERLGAIGMPTLVVTSDGDVSIPAAHGERIAGAIPEAAIVRLEGAGHLGPVERPEVVNEALDRLLERAWSST